MDRQTACGPNASRALCLWSGQFVRLMRKENLDMMKTMRVVGLLSVILLPLGGCLTPQSRVAPLAPDIMVWVAERKSTSCTSLQPRYRIAAGVKTSLTLKQYRTALLDELSGSGRPPMTYKDALSLSRRSSKLLRAEIRRRCPKQRIRGKERIVYVPQSV